MRDPRGEDNSSMLQPPFPSLNAKQIRRKCRNHRSMGLALKVTCTSMGRMNIDKLKAGVLVGTGMGHRRTTPFLFLILLQAGVLVMESLEPLMKRGAPL
ncbi:hypothetical protein Bca4012_082854 [Brassica carinata]|uniref:Uncharacterized protein n=1 Tax=Brassica carinata TaxID=52824 RepID=A0A8X7VBC2_BRACI|nr:hypothetical protein Bca52824_027852 [Brassica carinata]